MVSDDVFDFPIKRLPSSEAKVPNLGWLPVCSVKSTDHFVNQNTHNSDYYFVHSYAALKSKNQSSLTEHGDTFVSSVSKNNIFAVQFHPEKSHRQGLKIYRNFLSWQGGIDR